MWTNGVHVSRVIDNLFNDPDDKVSVYDAFEYQCTYHGVVEECQWGDIQGEMLKILGAIDISSSMGIETPARVSVWLKVYQVREMGTDSSLVEIVWFSPRYHHPYSNH